MADRSMANRSGMADDTDRRGGEPVNITVRGPRGGPVRFALAAIVTLLVVLLGLFAASRIFDWSLFGTRQEDRSGPVVVTALRDLSEYHAASGSYQIVIDLKEDTKLVPDALKGRRTLFLAIGTVDAFVDFGKIDDGSVQVSGDRTSVTVTLPHAQLAKPSLDPNQSRVLDRNLGLLDRLGGLFAGDPHPQDQQLWVAAEQKIADAARQGDLTGRAEANTRRTLERMLTALGFTSVQVHFAAPSPGR
jgi:Protein of unknown function (DUF4230)